MQDETGSGEELSKTYCTSCHLYPEPSLLDKKTWQNHVLVRMGAFLGIFNDNVRYYDEMPKQWLEPGYGGERVLAAKIYPEHPLISRTDWEAIVQYYLTEAPDRLVSPGVQNLAAEIPGFRYKAIQSRSHMLPQITSIDFMDDQIVAGVYNTGVYFIDPKGKMKDSLSFAGMIVDVFADDNEMLFADIGSRYGRDLPMGKLYLKDYSSKQVRHAFDSLQRPVHINKADLDNDGDSDIVVCEYGFMLGQMVWYENIGEDEFNVHVLHNDDGAIRTEIRDFDGNGFKDIMVLIGNSDEGIDIYFNEGNKEFNKKRVLRFPPTNGSTHFRLIDWDEDGDEDILYTEGDNGDYIPILKPHHGIRLFLNDGQFNFSETFHLPMNGVYKAVAADLNEDGSKDIAAISFHPDFINGAREGFVCFINNGNDTFSASTFPNVQDGRWMCMDLADIDSDDDLDIILGAFDVKTPEVPAHYAERWERESIPIVILENLLK